MTLHQYYRMILAIQSCVAYLYYMIAHVKNKHNFVVHCICMKDISELIYKCTWKYGHILHRRKVKKQVSM